MLPPTADLDLFLSDFGVTATVGGVSVTVLFDVPGKAMNMFDGQMTTTAPGCTMKSSDVTARSIAYGTSIAISGTTYTVTEIEPDGAGLTRLTLSA